MSQQAVASFRGDILVVDDSSDNLRLLSALLTRHGFEVRKATSGPRAIAAIHADAPDLILLDIKMPEMQGYEVCQRLKSDPTTCSIPIIFISALDDVVDKVKAFGMGGVDYITKPFEEAEVIARIENQLQIQRLQRQLIAQNLELERSNRELEQFAHVVSHDLQQPLQSITGFSKLLLLKYQGTLDETAQDYLQRMIESGSRMQKLIQNLLVYAQVGSPGRSLELVDCNLILKQVLDDLQSVLTERRVEFTTTSLPVVTGNPTDLMQLFQNLISNAVKFVRTNVTPQISISVSAHNHEWLFQFHDNGIGIDPQNLERIFEAFHRVHSIKKYPGTGIGLATCKKIVERYGGTIWVESQVNAGTTFYFTLAREPDRVLIKQVGRRDSA